MVHAGNLERFSVFCFGYVVFIPVLAGEQYFLHLRIGMGYSFNFWYFVCWSIKETNSALSFSI